MAPVSLECGDIFFMEPTFVSPVLQRGVLGVQEVRGPV